MAIIKEEYDPQIFIENTEDKYLFKYAPFNVFSLQSIVNSTLYFSHPKLLNDPLDCYTDIVLKNEKPFSQEAIDYLLNFQPNIPYYLKQHTHNVLFKKNLAKQSAFIKEFFVFHTNENFGVCSFSKTVSEELLWSHYADGCQGLCMVFDKERLIKSLKNNRKHYYELLADYVRYESSGQKLEVEVLESPPGFSATQKHLFTKKTNWAYEKEFRLIIKRGQIPKFTQPQDHLFSHFVPFEKKALLGIVIGERMPSENIELIKGILKPTKNKYIFLRSSMNFD